MAGGVLILNDRIVIRSRALRLIDERAPRGAGGRRGRAPASKPWTKTIHSLLRHLLAAGMPVPEPLDLEGAVETVRLVPGDAGQDCGPHQLGLEGVASAGHLLHRVHEASRT